MNIETQARAGALSHPRFSLCASLALAVAASVGTRAAVAQGIPSTGPTVSVGTPVVPSSGAGSGVNEGDAAPARYRADVIVDGSRVEIRTNNSSLNGILRTLSQQTGMQITGGVADQPVFGTYGPGPADQVLSELLEGTGTNMILRQKPGGGLGELILSPRLGGPSPPNPSTFRDDAEMAQRGSSTAPPAQRVGVPQTAPQSQVPPLPFGRPAMPSAVSAPTRTPVTPDPQGIAEPPLASQGGESGSTPGGATQRTGPTDTNPGRTGPATPSAPDTPKTPQQIYEELQKLRQQQGSPQ